MGFSHISTSRSPWNNGKITHLRTIPTPASATPTTSITNCHYYHHHDWLLLVAIVLTTTSTVLLLVIIYLSVSPSNLCQFKNPGPLDMVNNIR